MGSKKVIEAPSKNKKCGQCGEVFLGHRNRRYCQKVKIKLCKYEKCCNYYRYTCGKKYGNFCSINCQNYYISRETDANIKRSITHQRNKVLYRGNYLKAMEEKYGVGVTNPSQLPEVKDKRRKFLMDNPTHFSDGLKNKFGENIVNISQVDEYKEKISDGNKISQNTLETKLKILKSSYPYMVNVEEYLTLDFIKWARDYRRNNNIKPTPIDLQLYFNFKSPINIPYEAKEFYNLKDSPLEVYFKNILIMEFNFKINEDFYRRKRFLRNEVTGRGLELDFFLPKYMLAFEINDYGTHSRVDDETVGAFGNLKKGPKYSTYKRDLASNYGITVIEIWEEELSFSNRVKLISKVAKLLQEFNPTIELVKIYENKLSVGELLPLPKEFKRYDVESKDNG